MGQQHIPSRGLAWATILAAATVVGSLAAACLLPFTALAVMAAATLPARRAVAVLLAAWAFNQAAGFGFLGYPHNANAVLQGLLLAVASLAGLAVARAAGAASGALPRLGLAFAGAFATYEAVLWAGAHLTGGLATFAPVYVAQIAASEGLWFALLAALSLVLQRAAPAVAPPRPIRLRLA